VKVLTVEFVGFGYRSKSMSGSNAQIIRGAMVDLIKFYVGREIIMEELSQIVGFICAVHDEVLVSICLFLHLKIYDLDSSLQRRIEKSTLSWCFYCLTALADEQQMFFFVSTSSILRYIFQMLYLLTAFF